MVKYADVNGLSHAFTVIKNALAGKADSSHTHNGLVPSGGTAGQVLSKSNATDYNMAWTTPTLPTASTSTLGGVKMPTDYSFWMNGDVLTMMMPPFALYYDANSGLSASWADLTTAISEGKVLYVVEFIEAGDPQAPVYYQLNHPVLRTFIDDQGDGYGMAELTFELWDDSEARFVTNLALLDQDTGEWTIVPLGKDTLIEDVEIAIPSTASGSNASGKSAYTQTPGYSPIGVVGYDWKSGGTRNNFFNFYKMDVSTAENKVIVSACNLHGSSAASGTVIVKTLMKRSDLI